MNTHTAIKVDGLSKCYRIGLKENMHDNFAGAVIDFLKKPVTNYYKYRSLYRFDDIGAQGADIDKAGVIWALKDVNFEVQKGQVLGIIGRNGAGKSTLLKILSRITEPTHGQAAIRGKVSSLLEVGTGFHPELTGRENIYLNGSVLGMKKKDIDAQYDEIVDFSGIEKFIDTPIKRYSSGMKVRLAFAVAAHLKPEVLVIDEVLAVGDAAFQKKCLGKMHDITTEGRTVLFVSHNMGAIMQLCPKSLLLSDGTVTDYGPSKDVVENYLSQVFTKTEDEDLSKVQRREGDGRLRFTSAHLRSAGGAATSIPIAGEDMEVILNYKAKEPLSKVRFVLTIFNQMGIAVTNCSVEAQGDYYDVPGGSGSAVCRIERLPLPLGQYKISIAAFDDIGRLDQVRTACVFDIEACKFYDTAFAPPIRFSTALVDHSWRLEKGNGNKRLSETTVGNDSII